jgi:hypothetical protein
MKTRLKATLYVTGGSWDPEDCTTALGIRPTRTFRRGTSLRLRGHPAPDGVWFIDTEWTEVVSTDDAVARLVSQVWGSRSAIQQFCRKNNATIDVEVTVEIYDERPIFELTSGTMARLLRLGANFGIDIFDYREGQRFCQWTGALVCSSHWTAPRWPSRSSARNGWAQHRAGVAVRGHGAKCERARWTPPRRELQGAVSGRHGGDADGAAAILGRQPSAKGL